MTTLLKKLTVKHVCGSFPTPAIGREDDLMVIMGYVKSSETKVTTFGESIAFHGDFKGINIATGEEFRAGTCYLPDVAANLLENILEDNEGVVEFGFKISVIGIKSRTEAEGTKYEYRCKPLMNPNQNDPMLALEDRLKGNAVSQGHNEKAAAGGKKASK